MRFLPPAALLATLVVAAPALPANAQTPGPAQVSAQFDQVSEQLTQASDKGIMRGGSGQPVVFDEAAARAQGFSPLTITVGKQLAAQSNAIVADQAEAERTARTTEVSIDTKSTPELEAFWSVATERERAGAKSPAAQQAEQYEQQPEANLLGIPGISHIVCGYYPNPKPRSAAPWKTYSTSDPAGTLSRWGYHRTPGLAGGGWTRGQTYKSLICGVKTYRDHAIAGSNNVREQNYTGSPGGEPNPEVYRTGPWPYADWPAYVYWWHRTH